MAPIAGGASGNGAQPVTNAANATRSVDGLGETRGGKDIAAAIGSVGQGGWKLGGVV